jgi:hypothetical protein
LEFYDKLNISVRGHSRQIVWKDVWVFTNSRDILYLDPCCSIGARIDVLPLWKIKNGRFMLRLIYLHGSGGDI